MLQVRVRNRNLKPTDMLQGRVWLYRGPQLVRFSYNQIHQDLWDYLTARLDSGVDAGLNNLFSEHGAQADHVGKDGIIYQDQADDSWHTMQTSFISAPDANTRRLSGLIIPEAEEGIAIQNFQLGHDLQAFVGAGDQFGTMFATNNQPTEELFFPDVPVVLVWEIGVAVS